MTHYDAGQHEKLEPCPFCGEPSQIQFAWTDLPYVTPGVWRVRCKACDFDTKNFNTAANATTWWNRRAALAAERATHAETHAQLASAILALSEANRRRGEAEGRIAALEIPGVVEGWRERALAAEFANAKTRARCEALEAALQPFSDMWKNVPGYMREHPDYGLELISEQDWISAVNVGDLRRAAAALDPKTTETGR